jgi:hypothetical protein
MPKSTRYYRPGRLPADIIKRALTRQVDPGAFFVGGTVDVQLNVEQAIESGRGFARIFAEQSADFIADLARKNVAPGGGPGTHPHRKDIVEIFGDWPDTGALRDAITTEVVKPPGRAWQYRFQVSVIVQRPESRRPPPSPESLQIQDPDYHIALETGFFGPSGVPYIYPYVGPAMQAFITTHWQGVVDRASAAFGAMSERLFREWERKRPIGFEFLSEYREGSDYD